MTRREFTRNIGKFIVKANEAGFEIIGDWWFRDKQAQQHVWATGMSNLDGVEKISNHQHGKAVDIFIYEGNDILHCKGRNAAKEIAKYHALHDLWDEVRGEPRPRIHGDLGHFE